MPKNEDNIGLIITNNGSEENGDKRPTSGSNRTKIWNLLQIYKYETWKEEKMDEEDNFNVW